MNQQRPDPDFLRHRDGPQHGVAEQPSPEATALHRYVDAETCEEDCRDLVSRHPFRKSFRGVFVADGRNRQPVVSHDTAEFVVAQHESACRSGRGRTPGVIEKPQIERRDPTVEAVENVSRTEPFGA